MMKYLAVNEPPNLQRLTRDRRDAVLAHLLDLDPRARRMRFGHHVSDECIAQYVQGLDFDRDLVLGWLYDHGRLLAMVHLAHVSGTVTEFAISVVESLRGGGHGKRLTREALRIAADLGYGIAHIQFLAANRPMAAIVDHFAGAHHADGGERLVDVPLPAMLRRAFKPPLGPFAFGGFTV
jgi:GNAT superfamily N-acetyltransferase